MIVPIKTDEDVVKANTALADTLEGWANELRAGKRETLNFVVDVNDKFTEVRIAMSNQKEKPE